MGFIVGHDYNERHIEADIEDAEFAEHVLVLAMRAMTDNELLAFVMYYGCGVEELVIARAIGKTQQGVSYLLKTALGKVRDAASRQN
jgi:DNA-directed RNA polymerase specialized sigma subunit